MYFDIQLDRGLQRLLYPSEPHHLAGLWQTGCKTGTPEPRRARQGTEAGSLSRGFYATECNQPRNC